MLKSLRTMDAADRRRLLNELIWLLAVVALTLGSEGSHWWRHRADVTPVYAGAEVGTGSVAH
jgi:hypothetical protein